MSFQTYETSAQGADPQELYRFVRGDKCWLYTSSDEDVVFQGETFLARTVSRGSFVRNEEAVSSELRVRLDRSLALVGQFIDGSSPEPVFLTLYRLHRPDAQAIIIFYGKVANATIELEEISLLCRSPLGDGSKEVPRELILRTCPHVLYGERCRVDSSSFSVATTISSTGGDANQYTVASDGGQADGWFDAGVLVVVATGQRAFIQAHVGNVLTLLTPVPGLSVSDSVILYAGCDRRVETCRDKFDNVPQFGGFPLHPERNPFVQITAD